MAIERDKYIKVSTDDLESAKRFFKLNGFGDTEPVDLGPDPNVADQRIVGIEPKEAKRGTSR